MLFKFYIWGKFNSSGDDGGEMFIVAEDLNSAYAKLVTYVKHSLPSFRLMTVKLMDISTSLGVMIDWFKNEAD